MARTHGGVRWLGVVPLGARRGWSAVSRTAVSWTAVSLVSWFGAVAVLGCESRPVETATAVAGLQTAELHVQGTDCASCEVSIRRHLRKLEGVSDIRPGDDKQHVFVDFDPVKVTPEQIAKAVLDAGYEAEILVHAMAT